MTLITSDKATPPAEMLEAYDCPAILITVNYQIIAFNNLYERSFGTIELDVSLSPTATLHPAMSREKAAH
jgi:hypothetical protein